MMAGGLIVPYVPKVFYPIPGAIEPPDIITPGSNKGRWIFVNSEIPIKSPTNPKGIHDGKSFNTAYQDLNDALNDASEAAPTGDIIFLSGSQELKGSNLLSTSGLHIIGKQIK